MTRSYDVIIIGAGLTGMQCGALLAQKSQRVLLVDRNAFLGGRGQVVRRDGFTLDHGFHFARFGARGPIATIARYVGHDLALIDLGECHLYRRGQKSLFPTGVRQLFSTDMLSWREKLQALRLFTYVRRTANFDHLSAMTVDAWMDDFGISGQLRTYLTCASINLILCPFTDRASASELLYNLRMTIKAGKSAAYPAHGWDKVYEAYTDIIWRDGDVRLGSPVESILVEAGRARGVVVGGEAIAAMNVIFCAPVQALPKLVAQPLDPGFLERTRRLKPSAGIVLDIALGERVSEACGLEYFTAPYAFGYFPSNVSGDLAPAGRQLASFFIPTTREDVADDARSEQLIERLRREVNLAYPRLAAATLWERVLRLPFVFGAELITGQDRNQRVDYAVPGIENLFVLGDSTRAGAAGGDIGHLSVLEFIENFRIHDGAIEVDCAAIA